MRRFKLFNRIRRKVVITVGAFKFVQWLQGKKTYIILFVIAFLSFLTNMGWLEQSQAEKIIEFLTPLAGATAYAMFSRRLASQNSEPPNKDPVS